MADIKKKLVDGAGLQAAMGIMADFADKGVRGSIGGYNQSFPLTAATKGNIYYHKGTNRYYICVDNYNGSSLTNPNSKFEELSVYTNRQRLDNLITITTKGTQLPIISRINDLKICFIQSSANVPTGYHEDIYHTENNYKIIPLSVTWKDNIHRNDYIAFDYEVTNSTITVAYNASTTSMSYLLVYLLVR